MRETQKVYVRRKMREVYVGREDERQKQKVRMMISTVNQVLGQRMGNHREKNFQERQGKKNFKRGRGWDGIKKKKGTGM